MKLTFIGADHEVTGSCHLVEACGKNILVDCGMEQGPDLYENQEIPVALGDIDYILLTHAHVDHLAGLNQLREAFPDAKFYMDKRDEELLRDPNMNLSDFLPEPIVCKPADVWVKDRDIIKTCGLEFTVLDTAGHTPGGISFYLKNEGIVFTGDSLFQGSIGRTDFPGGNLKELLTNIMQNLFQLPDSVRVLSGHGEITTVGYEKESNPFFQEGF